MDFTQTAVRNSLDSGALSSTILSAFHFISRLESLNPMDSSASRPVTAIYPGSFDPVTNGHLDLITRASNIFGKLIVAVAHNLEKDPLFTEKERVEMLETATFKWDNVQIDVFDGLLMDYARAKGASVIVRGIRAVSDYEYELQMAMMNRKIEPDIETVFMLPAEQYSYLSSRLVKELARLGGPTKDFVPAVVHQRLSTKFK
jgi:pantetheine-phosphate adenylyltransferase